MNIWLINHYALPIKYHPLARTTNFAKYLIRMGHTVTIFAASSAHNSDVNLITDGSLYREETVDGIHYVYIRCRSYAGNGYQRVINMFEFPRRLKRVCGRFPKPDAVLASSATPPACMAGLKIAKKYGARAVAEVSDLWPQAFVSYGLISAKNPLLIPMYAYEKKMYKTAEALIFTMEGAYDYIEEQGWEKDVPRSKVRYINNGVDLEQFNYNREHFPVEDLDLENQDIFKVIYAGSIREADDVGSLLDAAKMVKDPTVRFLIWGGGDELEFLKKRVLDEKIENVVFKGKVEKRYIPYIVSRADANLIHSGYRGEAVSRFGISLNKMFDCFAAGKPILMDLPASYNPLTNWNAGLCVSSAKELPDLLEHLRSMDGEELDTLCENARRAAEEYDFKNLAKKLVDVLKG